MQESKPYILIHKNGSIEVVGDINIIQPDGLISQSKKSFLCRCGKSNNKPYCDGTHRKINFEG